jgi:hypothetical protein
MIWRVLKKATEEETHRSLSLGSGLRSLLCDRYLAEGQQHTAARVSLFDELLLLHILAAQTPKAPILARFAGVLSSVAHDVKIKAVLKQVLKAIKRPPPEERGAGAFCARQYIRAEFANETA